MADIITWYFINCILNSVILCAMFVSVALSTANDDPTKETVYFLIVSKFFLAHMDRLLDIEYRLVNKFTHTVWMRTDNKILRTLTSQSVVGGTLIIIQAIVYINIMWMIWLVYVIRYFIHRVIN